MAQGTRRSKPQRAAKPARRRQRVHDARLSRSATASRLVALDRPEVHNAFNETLIAEMTPALRALDATTPCAPSCSWARARASAPAPT